ncbi:hypothetical protein [Aeromicrobium sp.]|uniref:hypothetical protein n=1 Tax=Aeromicrobium sp. TaxID=1871063 RepID=UPI0028ABCA33|nr:hypothetical protein [Aeromicrobium sp.]
MTAGTTVTDRESSWRDAAVAAAHRLAVASCVGALLGLVVGGVGGRLFMGLLASLNAEDHGVTTSDGFPMGELTAAGTANLLLVGTALGVLGAGTYLTVRTLAIGPGWFRRLSVMLGGTVTVGAVLVHEDGPDFTLLEPTWAAIGLTLAAPFAFCLAVGPAVDRAVRDESWWMRTPATWIGLAPWAFPLFVATPLVVGAWSLGRVVSSRPPGSSIRQAGPWVARAVLVVVFLLGAARLVSEIIAIYDTVSTGRYLLG